MKNLLFAGLLSMLTPNVASAQDFYFDEMSYSPAQTTFKLFAPKDAKKVVVRLYKDGLGGKAQKTVNMQCAGDDLWTTTVQGDLRGRFYTFDIGRGETPGVFAKAVGVNGKRGAILGELPSPAPQQPDWDPQRPVVKSPADLVIYELHHRDFSIARKDAKYPGKYLALTEPWAIEHLKSLGIQCHPHPAQLRLWLGRREQARPATIQLGLRPRELQRA